MLRDTSTARTRRRSTSSAAIAGLMAAAATNAVATIIDVTRILNVRIIAPRCPDRPSLSDPTLADSTSLRPRDDERWIIAAGGRRSALTPAAERASWRQRGLAETRLRPGCRHSAR